MIQPTHGMLQKLPETSFSSAVKQLYLLALLSLGDPAAAEQTVREALLYTARKLPGNPDSDRFFAVAVKQLYRNIKKAGKIRYIGLSNFSPRDTEIFMSMTEIHCQQSLYNMLERNTDSYHGIPLEYQTEKEILPMVKKYGQAFLPYSPLFQGLLTGRFTNGRNFSEKDIRNENPKLSGLAFDTYYGATLRLSDICKEIDRPMSELALNWLRQKPEVTSIIGGASSLSQLEKNLHSLSWDIPVPVMAEIDDILKPFENL